jgi:hypothetical protein
MTPKLLLTILELALTCVLIVPGIVSAQSPTPASGKKPNILVIFGDDIGQTNISAYSFGVMGYQTPNIDRIAKEGMIFTDYYAEQSCTAGRSSFITGQCTLRTGLSKVGIPAAAVLRFRPHRRNAPQSGGISGPIARGHRRDGRRGQSRADFGIMPSQCSVRYCELTRSLGSSRPSRSIADIGPRPDIRRWSGAPLAFFS